MASGKTNTAQINDDWQYLNESKTPNHPTTDQQFNIHYKDSGMQSISNIKIEKRKDPPKAANDPTFNVSVTTITKKEPVEVKNLETEALKLLKTSPRTRAKANAVTVSIGTWYGWVWVTQLIFAVISIIAFGSMALGSEAASENIINQWTANLVNSASKFFLGYSFADGIQILFIATHAIVMAIGFFSLLAAFLQYKISGLNPLNGNQSSLKQVSLLLILIGYSMPILNLFPWMYVWIIVVWKYPK